MKRSAHLFSKVRSNPLVHIKAMSTTSNSWLPPAKIEELFAANQSKFSNINAPTAGARSSVELAKGETDFQLYSLATPNGMKPAIMLEELGIPYDAYRIDISKGEQFGSGFVDINPNSKIPCAVDQKGDKGEPIKLFESASIVLYLAEKYDRFIPKDVTLRAEVMNWLFWQMSGQGPMCGNFGHFMVYAPDDKKETRDYGVARYGMEVQRLCSVLNNHLKDRQYLVNNEYTIADIVCYPWARQLRTGYKHEASGVSAATFLSIEENYPHMIAWVDRIGERPAVQRGVTVCQFNDKFGAKPWLHPDYVAPVAK